MSYLVIQSSNELLVLYLSRSNMADREGGQVATPLQLQDLIEKLIVLRKAMEVGGRRLKPITHPLIVEKVR